MHSAKDFSFFFSQNTALAEKAAQAEERVQDRRHGACVFACACACACTDHERERERERERESECACECVSVCESV